MSNVEYGSAEWASLLASMTAYARAAGIPADRCPLEAQQAMVMVTQALPHYINMAFQMIDRTAEQMHNG